MTKCIETLVPEARDFLGGLHPDTSPHFRDDCECRITMRDPSAESRLFSLGIAVMDATERMRMLPT